MSTFQFYREKLKITQVKQLMVTHSMGKILDKRARNILAYFCTTVKDRYRLFYNDLLSLLTSLTVLLLQTLANSFACLLSFKSRLESMLRQNKATRHVFIRLKSLVKVCIKVDRNVQIGQKITKKNNNNTCFVLETFNLTYFT